MKEFRSGDRIGDYRLLEECGRGAYGVVWLVQNQVSRAFFALKIVFVGGRSRERELHGLCLYQKKCFAENLLPILHIGEFEDALYYIMPAADALTSGDYVPDTLGNRLARRRQMPPEEVLTMTLQILSALDALHRQGMVHRDIKPDNILWIDGKAMLADIGLIAADNRISFAGTPHYIPAESWQNGEVSTYNDLYALGKVIYCALTGEAVEHFPHFPVGQTLSGGELLIAAYTAVCAEHSKIRSVKAFQALLQPARRTPKRRKIRLPHIVAACALALSGVVLWGGIRGCDAALTPAEAQKEYDAMRREFRSRVLQGEAMNRLELQWREASRQPQMQSGNVGYQWGECHRQISELREKLEGEMQHPGQKISRSALRQLRFLYQTRKKLENKIIGDKI